MTWFDWVTLITVLALLHLVAFAAVLAFGVGMVRFFFDESTLGGERAVKFGTYLEVFYGDNDQWYFRTVNAGSQVGDVSSGYARKTEAVRAAKRWHPGVPLTIRPKEPYA